MFAPPPPQDNFWNSPKVFTSSGQDFTLKTHFDHLDQVLHPLRAQQTSRQETLGCSRHLFKFLVDLFRDVLVEEKETLNVRTIA